MLGFIQGPLRGARACGAGPARRQVKKALLGAAAQVADLTTYVGTEIESLQLGDLTDRQRDELALLVAERSVDLSLQQQLNLGKHFGEVEVHPQVPYVPDLPGVHIMWPNLQAMQSPALFRRPGGASRWHSDLVHEKNPAGLTHLHNDGPIKSRFIGDTIGVSDSGEKGKYNPGADGNKGINSTGLEIEGGGEEIHK
ncbi:alpha-ketoglutarate-dependent taurine dioxygenase [Pyricularia oryzae 70-15]|uniref:Alpha-ketoglutarate-dependent taurine dioxygenase n=1 Tax=Pyricularia oryzae (strain 70-15 / ATCC MYA-4617 / FGSC 8958) TaxID=242507 RepID=G4MQI6_PYRO7|nr:alpha-ketoglutarate-dependent taurine dioxygenase [Pyricularia oryzae 70-15]EHA56476.1 alpha-ketoglutarate-dependent taurine dioxygenase [Pyricularia oryzae 70-15]